MERRIICTICFICGALGAYLQPPQAVALTAALFVGVCWRPSLHRRSTVALLCLCWAVGLARGLYDGSRPAEQLPQRAAVEGYLLESPRKWGKSSVFFFQVTRLDGQDCKSDLKLLVRWGDCDQTLEPGDFWHLEGRFSAGERACYPGGFDQQEWLWCQGARGALLLDKRSVYRYLGPPRGYSPRALACRCRQWMIRRLRVVSGEPERALVTGVVFGETAGLSKEVQGQFRRTGTTHLLAASGMNVALLAGLIAVLGARLGLAPWRMAPLAIPPVILYAFLACCSPSIVRAALATTLALLAAIWGRRSCPWNSMCLSVWGLLLFDPRQLFDLGFQLSSVAVIGLVLSPKAPKAWGNLGSAAALTCSATLATLPIMWSSFGQLSSTLLPANLFLGPAVEALFPLGLLLSVCPLKPLAWLATMLAKLCLLAVALLANSSSPCQLTPPHWLELLLWLLACLFWFGRWGWRYLAGAGLLVALALAHNNWVGQRPQTPLETLVVRRVGPDKPVYWVSLGTRELLILSEPWQESRAKAMLPKLGCLHRPEVKLLPAGQELRLGWKDFHWQQVEPLLVGAPYSVVTVRGAGYKVDYWWPKALFKASKPSVTEG